MYAVLSLFLCHCAQDNELQGTLVTRLQRRVDGMQKIALKVQNVLDDVASVLERCQGLICWADPNASAFFLLIATAWALGIAVLGLHTILSALLCWMVSTRTPCRCIQCHCCGMAASRLAPEVFCQDAAEWRRDACAVGVPMASLPPSLFVNVALVWGHLPMYKGWNVQVSHEGVISREGVVLLF